MATLWAIWRREVQAYFASPIAYVLLADARLRDNQADSVVDILRPAYERNPGDSDIGQRLMSALLITGRFAEALPVLDRHLQKNPSDQVALFAAVYAQYHVVIREKLALSPADQAKLARYVKAYQGPYQPLLAKYLEIMRR